MNQTNTVTDWMGVTASVACAIHCAAMPFVVAFLPALGLSFLADELFHQVMVGVCSLLALAAFIPGLRRHRRLLPLGIGAIGLTLIATAAFALEDECCSHSLASEGAAEVTACTEACCEHCDAVTEHADEQTDSSNPATASLAGPLAGWVTPLAGWITPLGGCLLVTAHLTNRRFSCGCGCCPSDADPEASA